MSFDLDRAWQLHPQVALRPEAFGALAYHFGTRRLSFLKTTRMRDVVETLAEHPTARAACAANHVDPAEVTDYATALARLAATKMIIERSS